MPPEAPKAAQPTKVIFDPFNSSATGHQRADSRLAGSTSWRDSRSQKLRSQFSSGSGGGKRVSDTVGAGSVDFGQDGRLENGSFMPGAKGLRPDGQRSIFECMPLQKDTERPAKRIKIEDDPKLRPTVIVNPWTPFRREDGKIRESSWPSHHQSPSQQSASPSDLLEVLEPLSFPCTLTPIGGLPRNDSMADETHLSEELPAEETKPRIFDRLVFYINGSTVPHSDHKIKYLLSSHGGSIYVSHARRKVTHVILGRPNSAGGCGGGLASSKIQKEVTGVRSINVKYITADWIVDSVEAGKRLPENRYKPMSTAPKGVGSVANIFQTKRKADATPS